MTLSFLEASVWFSGGTEGGRDARIIECADDAFPFAPLLLLQQEKAFVLQAPPRSGLRTLKCASSHELSLEGDAKMEKKTPNSNAFQTCVKYWIGCSTDALNTSHG